MALFQKTVEQKYLKQLNSELINEKYLEFKTYFGNTYIQENIRNSKEEQFQEGFLRELFVKLLGYTLNPTPNFNLTTEYKNIKDSKKADGAIIFNDLVKAVIELKGTNTTDLGKIEVQAFGYKNNQPHCVYVITSNFEKLRFYIDNAIEHIEFNLFTLTKTDFEILYLCLSSESIEKGIPKKVKEESLSQEDTITKKLYQDYSLFKRELHQNLVSLNPQFDSLTLFKKSQKLLDRFLFLFFAEDRQLLPPNSVRLVLNDWRELQERDEDIPLYKRFKKYFEYLNTGYKGKRYDVFAYNGGLFKPDDILDTILIDDELLFKHTYKLSEYNFASEVDVNILGHIFENSLNELDELETSRGHAPLAISKRKKDGVFYTPKYITKYIVENTVGKLCAEKKTELQFIEEEFTTMGHAPLTRLTPLNKKTKQALYDKLKTYQNWLLQITICDPACGSGAFLNQALDFLIAEHRYIDELQAKLLGVPLILSDYEKSILENNLFGVDLNEESVEIAKLSLWLRTAQPNRKLNDLNNNIKCGNSLIDDPAVAGDKAFNWHTQFPTIFQKKDKKVWHVTTATHNSRYSQRMFNYHIETGDAEWIDKHDEIVITQTVRDIALADKLHILEYNLCGDHMHLLLACTDEELPGIVGKIKSLTAKNRNRERGYTISGIAITRGHAPLSFDSEAPLSFDSEAPLSFDSEAPLSFDSEAPLSSDSEAPLPFDSEAPLSSDSEAPLPFDSEAPLSSDTEAPLSNSGTSRGTTQHPLWTQKFGKTIVESQEYYHNAIEYIRNNRTKHGLPANPEIEKLKKDFICTEEYAYRPEYTGGFDVVIGNPPYVHLEKMKDISDALSRMRYKTFDKRGDLYGLFVEQGFNILKPNGVISYIMPNKWLQAGYGKPLREYFLSFELNQLIDFGDIQIFEGATTYPCIFVSRKAKPKTEFTVSVLKEANKDDFYVNVEQTTETFKVDQFSGETWVISSGTEQKLIERLKTNFKTLTDFVNGEAYYGLKTGLTEAFLIDEITKTTIIAEDPKSLEVIKPFLLGRDAKAYATAKAVSYLILLEKGFTKSRIGNTVDVEEAWSWFKQTYPAITKWLEPYEDRGKNRTDKGDYWWEIRACDYYEMFSKPKIMYQKFQVKPCFIFDESGLYCNDSMWIIPTNDKGLLAVLNSKMGWWLITKYCTQIQNGCQLIWKYFGQIPVPATTEDIAAKADQMLSLNKQLQETAQKFQRNIQREYNLEKLSGKLENWFQTPFNEFLKELEKSKVKLTLSQKAEWEDYFLLESKKALEIKHQIDTTDKEIDQMVYALYGLTDEEIAIVESSNQ